MLAWLLAGGVLAVCIYLCIILYVNHRHIAVDLSNQPLFPFDDKTGTLEDIPQNMRDLDGRNGAWRGCVTRSAAFFFSLLFNYHAGRV